MTKTPSGRSRYEIQLQIKKSQEDEKLFTQLIKYMGTIGVIEAIVLICIINYRIYVTHEARGHRWESEE